ncbi:MAG TPA: ribose-phosphate diphosphokinase [Longimicrobiales bacterium]|nr:ribose-phosphate diphosphokinase [Longimicrobiales bacterium]
MTDGGLRLFALSADRTFGEAVAAAAGVQLAPCEERIFEDGEHKTRPLVSVRGMDVYVLDSLYGDAVHSANDKLCRLLFFIGAVRDAGAARVTAVTPYLCYSRKDRRTKPRDPVTTRYIAALFEAVGADVIVTMDVHNPAAYQNAFRLRTEHLEVRPLLVRYLQEHAGDEGLTIVSPDAGGAKRATSVRESLARALGRDVGLAFLEKRRSEGQVSGDAVVGSVEGTTAIIVDDLISSGTTIARAAQACRARGAARVWAAATHALFTAAAGDTLGEPALERLIVSNTVVRGRIPESLATKVAVLDVAPLTGEAVRRMHAGGSIVELLSDAPPD